MPPSSSTPPPDRCQWTRWLVTAVMVALFAALYSLYTGVLNIPAAYNPWASLNVTAPPSSLTAYKLQRARSNPVACMAALAQTGMEYDMLPDRVTGRGCGFSNAVLLRQASVRRV